MARLGLSRDLKSALITGASSGIGEALASVLKRQGLLLTLSGRNEAQLDRVARSVGAQRIVVADLVIPEGRERLIDLVRRDPPDLVINCAGFGLYGRAIDHPVAAELAILEVNATVAAQITLEAARAWLEQKRRGVVLNVASVAAFFPMPGAAVYGAAKAALASLSQSLDLELREEGIRVLASCPGVVATHFQQRASKGKASRPPRKAMTADYAARRIWKQIEKEKPIDIFNWRYRTALFFSHLLPAAIQGKIVRAKLLRQEKANRNRR
jgi:uncharacterized protein